MYGVSKLTVTESVMLINYPAADAPLMSRTLDALAKAEIVVDMISRTAPSGGAISFSFTAPYAVFEAALKALSEGGALPSPMLSGGYTKLALYGEEMVHRAGVAARGLSALQKADVEIAMITTSDYDISILVRSEDADIAADCLKKAYSL